MCKIQYNYWLSFIVSQCHYKYGSLFVKKYRKQQFVRGPHHLGPDYFNISQSQLYVATQVQLSVVRQTGSGFWIMSKWPYLRPLKVLSTSKFCCSGVSKRLEFCDVKSDF